MNVNIRLLAEQALREVTAHGFSDSVVRPEGYCTSVSQAFVEQFATLVAEQCMKEVEDQYKPVLEDAEMMKDTHWDGYVQCGVDSYIAIREHFFGEENDERPK